jgi:hypothetical protein
MSYQSHRQIIDAWPEPSLPTFAADHGVKYETAKGWRRRNSIPAERWLDTIQLANRRGVRGVTHELLRELRALGKHQREVEAAA